MSFHNLIRVCGRASGADKSALGAMNRPLQVSRSIDSSSLLLYCLFPAPDLGNHL